MCLGRYIVLTSCLGNGVPWSCRPVIFWKPVEIGVLICVIKGLQSWHLWWHRHIFLMNFKIDVVVACAAGEMTELSSGMCWELYHHYLMYRPKKWGWRSQAIYQHSSLSYSWPLHSKPLLTGLKYRSEIIAPSRPWISMCVIDMEGIGCCQSVMFLFPAVTFLLIFIFFFSFSSKWNVSHHFVSWLST